MFVSLLKFSARVIIGREDMSSIITVFANAFSQYTMFDVAYNLLPLRLTIIADSVSSTNFLTDV